MPIKHAFNLLCILGGGEGCKRKGIPQVINARK